MFSLHPLSAAVCAGLLSAVHAAPATIDISIDTDGVSTHSSAHPNLVSVSKSEACLFICSPEPLECSEPSYAKLLGDSCWTCCTSFDYDATTYPSLGHAEQKPDKVASSEIVACLAVCYPEKPDCPSPLVVGGGPGCYTCCVDDGNSNISPSTQLPLLHSGTKSHSLLPSLAVKSFELTDKRDACLMVCYEEEPECPEGLYVGGSEGCWTCCLKLEAASKSSVPAKMSLLKDASKTKSLAISPKSEQKASALTSKNMSEACLMVCLEEEPDCQEPSYGKDLGNGCWTCCTSFDDDFSSSSTHHTSTAFNRELL